MTLLLEYCPFRTQFSFCSDGYEQAYRIFPLMIKYNGISLLNSYDTVYTLQAAYFQSDTLLKSFKLMEYINAYVQDSNCVKLFDSSFKKRTDEYFRRAGLDRKSNGNLYYALIEIEFDYLNAEEMPVILPSLRGGITQL